METMSNIRPAYATIQEIATMCDADAKTRDGMKHTVDNLTALYLAYVEPYGI